MREKLETLPVTELREIAKEQGVKNLTKLKKTEMIEKILEITSKNKKEDEVKKESKKEFYIEENPLPEKIEEPLIAEGILEVMPDGFGFIRCENFLPGENDVYVSPAQIRKFNLKTGDIIVGNTKVKQQNEKFSALLYVKSVNGFTTNETIKRPKFEDLTPIFPNERIRLESGQTTKAAVAMRMMDLVSPIGKGQRGMIVSPPKAGKTTLLKQVAKSITRNHPEMRLIILLIDERPEEVTDMTRSVKGEVVSSTFDEAASRHIQVAEMVIEKAKRLVEAKHDVVILLDSITRLARAYNTVCPSSGKVLTGGVDANALQRPKRFFGAARNIEEGGSLTIIATALVDTGSRMDDVIFEEFKGTGNSEIVLDRKLSDKRTFPAIDITKSGTRKEELLVDKKTLSKMWVLRRVLMPMGTVDGMEFLVDKLKVSKCNDDFFETMNQ